MGATAQGRKRGSETQRTRLVERGWELSALEQALAEARAGTGRAVFVQGPPGSGKSALLAEAMRLAARVNMPTAQGRGITLERDFLFGVAIQLFEPIWLACGPDQRASLLGGGAQLAAPLLDGLGATHEHLDLGRDPYAVIHGLFRVACNLVKSSPQTQGLLILVDDAHLADALSLRFLAYLADRVNQLPVVLLVAVGLGERSAEPKAINRVRRAAGDSLLNTQPLTPDGISTIVEAAFPRAEEPFSAVCAELTAGNPFLLSALIETVRAEELAPTARSLTGLSRRVPASIALDVSARLDELPQEVRTVAASVAAFPVSASLREVSRHSGLATGTVAHAADTLAAIEMLVPGLPLKFTSPLVRSAVIASMATLDRAEAMRRAKTILCDQQPDPRRASPHPKVGEPPAGAPDTAKPVDPTFTALAQSEPQLGSEPPVYDGQSRRRVEDALQNGQHLYACGRYREAAAVLDAALQEMNGFGDQLAQRALAAYVRSASLVDGLQRQALDRRAQMLRGVSGAPTPDQRSAIAHTVVHDALLGASRGEVRLMVDLAWGDGALLHAESAESPSWPLLLASLIFADEVERALDLCGSVLATGRRSSSAAAAAMVDACRSLGLYSQGKIAEAQTLAESLLDAGLGEENPHTPIALAVSANCHLERGRTDGAETVLAVLARHSPRESIRHPVLLELRARVRLAQHRAQEALEDALHAGQELRAAVAKASPGAIPWRSTAAFAYLRLGESRQARKLAREELHDARRIGLTGPAIRNLRVLGLANGGTEGLSLLSEAVKFGDAQPTRLEHMRALVDLGAALRRANRRADARLPLRRGLELAHKHGAEVLAGRAHVELVATGARPRRAAFTGVESLTPSQRRVAGLAAQGLTTRQIAESLFVTPKTVEFHLRAVYQKLDVSSRAELTTALAAA